MRILILIRRIFWNRISGALTFLVLITSFIVDVSTIKEMFKEDEVKNEVNVSGSWNFEFEIQKSSMKSYIGKTSEFTLHITHLDNKIDGRGEKWKYDGDTIPHSRRIKLNVQGKYENDTLEFTFKQFGSSRHSFGFAKAVFKDGKFEGTFNADAADSKGKIHGIKVKV